MDYRQQLLDMGCATDEQIQKMKSLGMSGGGLITMKSEDADRRIAELSGRQKAEKSNSGKSCHYCGLPATGFGFFDEPVCGECK